MYCMRVKINLVQHCSAQKKNNNGGAIDTAMINRKSLCSSHSPQLAGVMI